MKKIINGKETIMKDILYGYGVAHKDIIRIEEDKYVVRANPKEKGITRLNHPCKSSAMTA